MLFSRGKKASAQKANAQDPLVAIDIGTYKVRLIAGMVSDNGEVEVSYYDEVPSQGMVGGSVSDLNALSEVLSGLVQKYEKTTQSKFSHCFVGISGKHIESRNEVGEATVPTHTITEADRENALQHASSIKIADYKHIIHVVPQAYMTDVMRDNFESEKNAYIINPIGMSAMRLSVGVHLIACDEDQENNLRSAVENLSPDAVVDHVIFNGLAAADAVLTQAEKDIGVCLIDFGGGSVNVAVYHDGKLILTFGLGLGGISITKAIATHFGLPLNVSDIIKCDYGVAHSSYLGEGPDLIAVSPLDSDKEEDKVIVLKQTLANVIGYKLSDIFALISNRIDNYSRSIKEPIAIGAGYVITGGVSQTRSIALFAANQLKPKNSKIATFVKTRVGLPRGVVGNYDELNSPECATAIGLLRVGHAMQMEANHNLQMDAERKRQSNVLVKSWRAIKEWMSDEL